MEDEQRRIEAAKADPSRFAELYDEHFERVYAYVLRRVGDRSDAQDITADVLQSAIADPFQRKSRPLPEAPPETAHGDVERRAMLFRSVDRLPADQRRVIVMR